MCYITFVGGTISAKKEAKLRCYIRLQHGYKRPERETARWSILCGPIKAKIPHGSVDQRRGKAKKANLNSKDTDPWKETSEGFLFVGKSLLTRKNSPVAQLVVAVGC